jgi:hypothetical protein
MTVSFLGSKILKKLPQRGDPAKKKVVAYPERQTENLSR